MVRQGTQVPCRISFLYVFYLKITVFKKNNYTFGFAFEY